MWLLKLRKTGAKRFAQWVRTLAVPQFKSSEPLLKSQAWSHVLITPAWRGGDKWVSRACEPASLPKRLYFKFSERPVSG